MHLLHSRLVLLLERMTDLYFLSCSLWTPSPFKALLIDLEIADESSRDNVGQVLDSSIVSLWTPFGTTFVLGARGQSCHSLTPFVLEERGLKRHFQQTSLVVMVRGKLKTQDRISSCHFTRLWERLKIMAKLDNVSNSWAQVVSGIVNKTANNTIWSVVQRLVWGATVYFIWQERNIRLFGNDGRSSEELFKVIFESVRSRLMGLKLKVTPDVINAAEVRKFPIDKIQWGVWDSSFSPETYGNSLEFVVSSKATIQGFACEGFLTRQGSWVIIYLIFILFMDCTRGMDNGWHRYGSMSSCLRFLAYGDVLNYAGWSQYSLVIQSVLITLAVLNSQSIVDDYASLLIYSLTEFYSSIKFVYASSLNVVLVDPGCILSMGYVHGLVFDFCQRLERL
ncbi:hypothetical protein Tco_1153069 [Tanacetum coccineum]